MKKRSVLHWVDKLSPDVPILLLHGTHDRRVSAKHSEELADALSKNNIPHKLVIYPGDGHGLRGNREAVRKELISWFQQHL